MRKSIQDFQNSTYITDPRVLQIAGRERNCRKRVFPNLRVRRNRRLGLQRERQFITNQNICRNGFSRGKSLSSCQAGKNIGKLLEIQKRKHINFVFQSQEREAKNKMREKAKELQRQRMEANKKGIKSSSYSSSGGFGSYTGYTPTPNVGDSANVSNDVKPPSYSTNSVQ